ncbi:hypothetical protein Droror1_Dr00024497, partial [Drosera rotundifolia]
MSYAHGDGNNSMFVAIEKPMAKEHKWRNFTEGEIEGIGTRNVFGPVPRLEEAKEATSEL